MSTTITPSPWPVVYSLAKHHAILWCAGIDKLQFQPNGDISGMVSAEGELVPLKTRIKPSAVGGAVEKWLIQVALPDLSLCMLDYRQATQSQPVALAWAIDLTMLTLYSIL
jgi:hypothetical protein